MVKTATNRNGDKSKDDTRTATNQNGDMATTSKPKRRQSLNQNGDKRILYNLRFKRHKYL